MERLTIIRHSNPTAMDHAQQGTRCMVKHTMTDQYELYVQTSRDQNQPKWDFIGLFNSQTAKPYVDQLVDMRMGIRK